MLLSNARLLRRNQRGSRLRNGVVTWFLFLTKVTTGKFKHTMSLALSYSVNKPDAPTLLDLPEGPILEIVLVTK